jgi:hypothetical protein
MDNNFLVGGAHRDGASLPAAHHDPYDDSLTSICWHFNLAHNPLSVKSPSFFICIRQPFRMTGVVWQYSYTRL